MFSLETVSLKLRSRIAYHGFLIQLLKHFYNNELLHLFLYWTDIYCMCTVYRALDGEQSKELICFDIGHQVSHSKRQGHKIPEVLQSGS